MKPSSSMDRRERGGDELPLGHTTGVGIARCEIPPPHRGGKRPGARHSLKADLTDASVEAVSGSIVARKVDADILVLPARSDGFESGQISGALEPDILELATGLGSNDDERRF